MRKKMISIHCIPTAYQLADIATKAQPAALFISQHESLLQWAAKFMTKEELVLPSHHLRACKISKHSKVLVVKNEDIVRSKICSQDDDSVRTVKKGAKSKITDVAHGNAQKGIGVNNI